MDTTNIQTELQTRLEIIINAHTTYSDKFKFEFRPFMINANAQAKNNYGYMHGDKRGIKTRMVFLPITHLVDEIFPMFKKRYKKQGMTTFTNSEEYLQYVKFSNGVIYQENEEEEKNVNFKSKYIDADYIKMINRNIKFILTELFNKNRILINVFDNNNNNINNVTKRNDNRLNQEYFIETFTMPVKDSDSSPAIFKDSVDEIQKLNNDKTTIDREIAQLENDMKLMKSTPLSYGKLEFQIRQKKIRREKIIQQIFTYTYGELDIALKDDLRRAEQYRSDDMNRYNHSYNPEQELKRINARLKLRKVRIYIVTIGEMSLVPSLLDNGKDNSQFTALRNKLVEDDLFDGRVKSESIFQLPTRAQCASDKRIIERMYDEIFNAKRVLGKSEKDEKRTYVPSNYLEDFKKLFDGIGANKSSEYFDKTTFNHLTPAYEGTRTVAGGDEDPIVILCRTKMGAFLLFFTLLESETLKLHRPNISSLDKVHIRELMKPKPKPKPENVDKPEDAKTGMTGGGDTFEVALPVNINVKNLDLILNTNVPPAYFTSNADYGAYNAYKTHDSVYKRFDFFVFRLDSPIDVRNYDAAVKTVEGIIKNIRAEIEKYRLLPAPKPQFEFAVKLESMSSLVRAIKHLTNNGPTTDKRHFAIATLRIAERIEEKEKELSKWLLQKNEYDESRSKIIAKYKPTNPSAFIKHTNDEAVLDDVYKTKPFDDSYYEARAAIDKTFFESTKIVLDHTTIHFNGSLPAINSLINKLQGLLGDAKTKNEEIDEYVKELGKYAIGGIYKTLLRVPYTGPWPPAVPQPAGLLEDIAFNDMFDDNIHDNRCPVCMANKTNIRGCPSVVPHCLCIACYITMAAAGAPVICPTCRGVFVNISLCHPVEASVAAFVASAADKSLDKISDAFVALGRSALDISTEMGNAIINLITLRDIIGSLAIIIADPILLAGVAAGGVVNVVAGTGTIALSFGIIATAVAAASASIAAVGATFVAFHAAKTGLIVVCAGIAAAGFIGGFIIDGVINMLNLIKARSEQIYISVKNKIVEIKNWWRNRDLVKIIENGQKIIARLGDIEAFNAELISDKVVDDVVVANHKRDAIIASAEYIKLIRGNDKNAGYEKKVEADKLVAADEANARKISYVFKQIEKAFGKITPTTAATAASATSKKSKSMFDDVAMLNHIIEDVEESDERKSEVEVEVDELVEGTNSPETAPGPAPAKLIMKEVVAEKAEKKLTSDEQGKKIAAEMEERGVTIEKDSSRGLQNQGQTCYMNAALQFIFSMTKVKDAILGKTFQDDDNDAIHALKQYMQKMSGIKGDYDENALATVIFENTFKNDDKNDDSYGGLNTQHDSQEVVLNLIDKPYDAFKDPKVIELDTKITVLSKESSKLEEDTEEKNVKTVEQNELEAARKDLRSEETHVFGIDVLAFDYYAITNEKTATECRNKQKDDHTKIQYVLLNEQDPNRAKLFVYGGKPEYNRQMNLSLPEKDSTFDQIYNAAVNGEVFTDDDISKNAVLTTIKTICGAANIFNKSFFKFSKNYIIIQLKRFNNDLSKITTSIDIENSEIPANDGTTDVFQILGCICHLGTFDGGHYTYASFKDGKPDKYYNDSVVSDLDTDTKESLKKACYVLLFERVTNVKSKAVGGSNQANVANVTNEAKETRRCRLAAANRPPPNKYTRRHNKNKNRIVPTVTVIKR